MNNISAKLGSNGKKDVVRDLGHRNKRTLQRLMFMLASVILLQALLVWGMDGRTIVYPVYGVYIFCATSGNAYFVTLVLCMTLANVMLLSLFHRVWLGGGS
jgi:predicted small integral membrane protein